MQHFLQGLRGSLGVARDVLLDVQVVQALLEEGVQVVHHAVHRHAVLAQLAPLQVRAVLDPVDYALELAYVKYLGRRLQVLHRLRVLLQLVEVLELSPHLHFVRLPDQQLVLDCSPSLLLQFVLSSHFYNYL